MNKCKIFIALAVSYLMLSSLSACSDNSKNTDQADSSELTVYCFNAGKADAHLIYGKDWAVLIDCGEKGFGKEILKYMQENDIERLDYLMITHFDKDHVGGAAKILKDTEVGGVLQSNFPKDSSEYEKYIAALEKENITPVTVRERTSFELGGAEFIVDPPQMDTYEKDPSNNSSLITEIAFGDNHFLFAGDAEEERLSEYNADLNTTFDFVKVPYHGHWQEELITFAEKIEASATVITSSEDEPEDAETTALFERMGAEIFFTRVSDVMVKCNGDSITAEYVDAE